MGYVEDSLMPGENVVYRTTLHWAVYSGAVALGLIALISVVAGVGAVGAFFLALALIAAVVASVAVNSSEFAVTNKRVLIKLGWLNRRSLEILLSKVEGIGVEQGLSGKILGYGTIVVTGTGGTHERFKNIAAPFELRKRIHEQAATAQDTSRGGGTAPAALPTGREERDCPYCAERILAKARVCKHCGREVQPLA